MGDVSQAAGNRPRVLILVENESVPHDRRVADIARSLAENSVTVSVICPADLGEPLAEDLGGVLVRRYRSRPSKGGARSQIAEYLVALWRTFWLMVSLWRSPGFDIIHACNPPDLFYLVAWPFKALGARFVFDQHDLAPELYSALYGRDSGAIMGALRMTERASYRASDAVVTVNESYKRLAISRGGVEESRVFVVRNGPRENWPRDVAPDPALKRGRRYLVVYVGVMGQQDGVDVLLEAAAHLVHAEGFADATFALVGDGAAVGALKAQAASLGVAEYVDFVGWVADQDVLSAYLRTADACACPEPSSPLNDHSTFVKVMEYVAASTPIVAFDLPETRVSAGDAALYAPPGDVAAFAENLRLALEDDAIASRMRQAARERITSLRWERQVPALLAAYECALADRRTRG